MMVWLLYVETIRFGDILILRVMRLYLVCIIAMSDAFRKD